MFFNDKKMFFILLSFILLITLSFLSLIYFNVITINVNDNKIDNVSKNKTPKIETKKIKKEVTINDFLIKTKDLDKLKDTNGLLYIKNANCDECNNIEKALNKIVSSKNINLYIVDLSQPNEKKEFEKYIQKSKELGHNIELQKLKKDLFSMNTEQDKEILIITGKLSEIEDKYNVNDSNLPKDIQIEYDDLKNKLNLRVNEKLNNILTGKNKVANKVYTDHTYKKENAIVELKVLEKEQKLKAEQIYELILLEEKISDSHFLFNSLEFLNKPYSLHFVMSGKSFKEVSPNNEFSISTEILNDENKLYSYLIYQTGLYQLEQHTEVKEFIQKINENKSDSIFIYTLADNDNDYLTEELLQIMNEKGIKTANLIYITNKKDFSFLTHQYKLEEKNKFIFIKTKNGHIREVFTEQDLIKEIEKPYLDFS